MHHDYSTYWSVVVTAAVAGLAILQLATVSGTRDLWLINLPNTGVIMRKTPSRMMIVYRLEDNDKGCEIEVHQMDVG